METNGNGASWLKPIFIGVATLVVGAAILGSAGTSISNAVAQGKLEVTVEVIKEDVDANTEQVQGIDVMAEQINDIKEDVGKILEALERKEK